MTLTLDVTPFRKAVDQLAAGLDEARAHPGYEIVRDGVIRRFEYTYELCHKMLRRFLESTEPDSLRITQMSFHDLIRRASELGLLANGWDVWQEYRKARGTTSHTYDSVKAADVFARVPAFLADARALLEELERRRPG